MELNQLANLGEFIGGIAVLITLIYLSVQVKQGTKALASGRHHEMLEHIFQHNFSPASQNRDYAEFILRAQDSPEALDDTDWYRFVLYAYGVCAMWEDAYISHRRGLIDSEIWRAWDGVMRSLFTGKGYAKFWAQEGYTHSPLFREYIDSKIFEKRVASDVAA